MPLRQPSRRAADGIVKSSALLGRAPGLPRSFAPWGWPDENFQLGFWCPKWCRWGPFRIRTARCRYQNRLRRPRKSVGLTQNPQPFWESPSPFTLRLGRDGPRRGAIPVPCLLYIVYVQTGAQPSHSKNALLGEKTWDVTRHRLVESPKCSAKPSVPPCWFRP